MSRLGSASTAATSAERNLKKKTRSASMRMHRKPSSVLPPVDDLTAASAPTLLDGATGWWPADDESRERLRAFYAMVGGDGDVSRKSVHRVDPNEMCVTPCSHARLPALRCYSGAARAPAPTRRSIGPSELQHMLRNLGGKDCYTLDFYGTFSR
eukprot:SAG31_NODE_7521_length_1666_cov_1.456924_1_plen_154_part_10